MLDSFISITVSVFAILLVFRLVATIRDIELIRKLEKLKFSKDSFDKFDNPTNPLYKDYKDRLDEKWHDIGYNNAIDTIIIRLNGKEKV